MKRPLIDVQQTEMECPIYLNVEPADNNEIGGLYHDHLFVDEGSGMRRHSMPPSPFRLSLSSNDLRNHEVLRRVRSFKTTSKGVVNSGDIVRKRGSVSLNVTSGLTITSSESELTSPTLTRPRLASTASQASSAEHSYTSSGSPSYYRVLVLGSSGVGKSALINQFMSSENNVTEDPAGENLKLNVD